MTDLSKQLGEIKRRHTDLAQHWFHGGSALHKDVAALLHIIEVEIPGMLRALALEYDGMKKACGIANLEMSSLACSALAEEMRNQATLIESLTNEKEKG